MAATRISQLFQISAAVTCSSEPVDVAELVELAPGAAVTSGVLFAISVDEVGLEFMVTVTVTVSIFKRV